MPGDEEHTFAPLIVQALEQPRAQSVFQGIWRSDRRAA
jgi:hypothetical protein